MKIWLNFLKIENSIHFAHYVVFENIPNRITMHFIIGNLLPFFLYNLHFIIMIYILWDFFDDFFKKKVFQMACCVVFSLSYTNTNYKEFLEFFFQPVFVIKTDLRINFAMMTDYVLVKRTSLVIVVTIAKLDHLVIPIA